MVVTDSPAAIGRGGPSEHAPPAAGRVPSKLLAVLVHKRTRMAGDVADGRGGQPVTVTQPAEPRPTEDTDGPSRAAGRSGVPGDRAPTASGHARRGSDTPTGPQGARHVNNVFGDYT
jgi:hypothetical protein